MVHRKRDYRDKEGWRGTHTMNSSMSDNVKTSGNRQKKRLDKTQSYFAILPSKNVL